MNQLRRDLQRMNKKWKTLFFLLLGINIFAFLLVIILINLPSEKKEINLANDLNEKGTVQFNIQATRNDLNKIINHYLESENLKSAIDYKIILQDEVELYGKIKIFTQDIEMKLTFVPEALENGDLILKQKSMSIGQLSLPVPYVLKFIHDQYTLPEWVMIEPNDELVYVSLQKMKLKSDMKVQANKFDLPNDDIKFTLVVPTE